VAKRRGRPGSSTRQLRDTFDIANLRLSVLTKIDPASLLREIEDRRTYHPERAARPARSLSKPRHRLVTPHQKGRRIPYGVRFDDPVTTFVCVRRNTRRQVLFAKKKTRKGSGARRRRRSWFSDVQC